MGDPDRKTAAIPAEFRWLTDGETWNKLAKAGDGIFRIELRATGALAGALQFRVSTWPDNAETQDE